MSKDTIYRQDAIDALGNEPKLWEDPYSLSEDYSKGQREQWNNDREVLLNLQSADVCPVVRCSECEHWNDGICYCDDYEIHCQDYYIGDMHTEPDFFCGFGKRKGVGE